MALLVQLGTMFGIFVSGCASDAGDVAIDPTFSTRASDLSSELPPKEWVDPKGHVWVRKSDTPVQIATAEEERAQFLAMSHGTRPEADKRVEPRTELDLSKLDVAEIAEMLRRETLINGYEYVTEPDFDSAAALKAGLQPARLEPTFGLAGAREAEMPSDQDLVGQAVIGSDGRTIRRNNTTHPHTTNILLSGSANGNTANCSASLVGPSTAVTVAHCLRASNGSWFTKRRWAPGVDSQDTNRYIFNPAHAAGASFPHSGARLVQGCYFAHTTPAWDGSFLRDWAVIEFDKDWWSDTCSETRATMDDKPGNTVGSLGLWAASAATITANSIWLYGYPGEGTCAGGSCFEPSIWGMGGLSSEVNEHAIEYSLDAVGGQSGTGVFIQTLNGSQYVVGMHRGFNQTCDPTGTVCWDQRNYARRMTVDVQNAIVANSEL